MEVIPVLSIMFIFLESLIEELRVKNKREKKKISSLKVEILAAPVGPISDVSLREVNRLNYSSF
jgi:hypothetical protein